MKFELKKQTTENLYQEFFSAQQTMRRLVGRGRYKSRAIINHAANRIKVAAVNVISIDVNSF